MAERGSCARSPLVHWIYHPGYNFGRGIPFFSEVHGFVLDKPKRIRDELIKLGTITKSDLHAPTIASEADLEAIHTHRLLKGLRSSARLAEAVELSPLAVLPAALTRHLVVKPQLHACGGTALALRLASEGQWAFNLGGGFHHARPDLSHGFCLVNDVAWGVHCLRQRGVHQRILVLDLDLHQGDGNSAAFADVEDVFTASLHQEDTFPEPKLESDIDLGLIGRETGDVEYAAALEQLLHSISERFTPQIVVYIAGTDPFEGDSVGAFQLSEDALIARDQRVARFARAQGASLVATTAGGYSQRSPVIAARGYAAMAAIANSTASPPLPKQRVPSGTC